jgi:cystathionine gamma-lyase
VRSASPKQGDGFGTLAVHAGFSSDPQTGAVMPPVYYTSTYAQSSPGVHKGFEYSRTQNPTRFALEANVAALEGGTWGLAFASGLAATTTVLHLLSSGDHVVAVDDLYGGTYRLFERVFRQSGLTFSYADPALGPDRLARAMTPATRLVWIETPTNPMLKLCDVRAVVDAARARSPEVIIAVDNTFLSPYIQRPLDLGADLAVQSAT